LKGFVGVGVRARVVAAMVGGQSRAASGTWMDARLQNRVQGAQGLMESVRSSWWSVKRRGGADLCLDAAGDERAWDVGYQATRWRRVVERARTAPEQLGGSQQLATGEGRGRLWWRGRAATHRTAKRQANGRGGWSTACQWVGWQRVVRRSVVKQGRAGRRGQRVPRASEVDVDGLVVWLKRRPA
jgi:hypothetical protein